jgi:cysteine desulfurase/selenocysteine lyase
MTTVESFSATEIRKLFPVLHQKVQGHTLVYLDNAATTQKPLSVIEALKNYYERDNSNVHRGAHALAERATVNFEETRKAVRDFIRAESEEEIIFTRGTTEAVNLVANCFGKKFLHKGDEVLITSMEHHSNIVPWQMICEERGAKLRVIPINEAGEILFEEFEKMLSEKTKIVSIVFISNALGTINPVKAVIEKAHVHGAKVMLDAAQAVAHMPVNVRELDCDFMAFSGHKMYAPTGIGVLYGKKSLLEAMPPYMGGGEMIKTVTFEKTTYNDLPHKFEAGTPNIADTVALKSAVDFINRFGKENFAAHENKLLKMASERVSEIDGLRIIGTAKEKSCILSFTVEGVHHYDLGMILDASGIAVRTGHHCTQPLMQIFGITGTTRASFAAYNTEEEVEIFAQELKKAIKILRK